MPQTFDYCPFCGERLKGMQGPEQGLVGEARSDEPTGPAEEAKPGERGVGEIGGADELRGYIERQIQEEWRGFKVAVKENNEFQQSYRHGKVAALDDLRKWLDGAHTKRSDLSNGQGLRPGIPERSES